MHSYITINNFLCRSLQKELHQKLLVSNTVGLAVQAQLIQQVPENFKTTTHCLCLLRVWLWLTTGQLLYIATVTNYNSDTYVWSSSCLVCWATFYSPDLRMKLLKKVTKPTKAIKIICLITKLMPITKHFGETSITKVA